MKGKEVILDSRIENLFADAYCNIINPEGVFILYEVHEPDIHGTESYTVSVNVCIDREVSGYGKGRSLYLMTEITDGLGICRTRVSRQAPDTVGKWEISVSENLTCGIRYFRCSFVYGKGAFGEAVSLSDIRITRTDSAVEAFSGSAGRPYTDIIKGNFQMRDYSLHKSISDHELIDYLIYASDHGYHYDLENVKKHFCGNNRKYNFLYDLFVKNDFNVFKQKNAVSFIQGLSEQASDRIFEKAALSGEYGYIHELYADNASASPYAKLLAVHSGITEGGTDNIKEYASCVDTETKIFEKNCFVHLCYADCEDLPLNRWLVKWFDKNYGEIRRRAKLMVRAETLKADDRPVFVFWDKGISEAPPVVKKCVGNMRSIFGDRLHVLDFENVKYYARMENCGGISSLAALSDYLRAELLMRYGGTWLDSTLFIKNDFCSIMNEHADIVPTYMPAEKHLGSWLLSVGERYSYFYCLLYSALNMFLYDHKDFKTYYMFHRFWEIICLADEEAALYWKNAYKLNARNALEMWLGREESLTAPRKDEEFYAFYDLSPVHKLTYKYNENEADFCSNISRMMRMGAENNAQKTKGIQELNGRKYYFDEISGKPVTGLKIASSENGSKKMMLYDKNGRMINGEFDISGFKLLFGDNGELEAVSEIKS